MISPDLIVFGSGGERSTAPTERYLVLIQEGGTTKCPLNQDLLTIGRSDSADIKIDGDYISRIHSRILRIGMDSVIEDADSRNGTRVNGEIVERHVLKHGDLIRVGTANFRFVDTAAGPLENE
jgi:pSer/pThr/pTyr-binding forkhead associated (FHA) protein